MANIKSAKKRALQNEARRKHNASLKSKYRTYVKGVVAAIASNNKEGALNSFKAAVPIIDKMAAKNVVPKNKAARHKSRLNSKIKKMG